MDASRLSYTSWLGWSASLLATAMVCGCATTSAKVAKQEAPPVNFEPAPQPNVQAVSLQSSTPDGQTSWIIQPEAPRTPKLGGNEPELPPHVARRMNYAFDLAQRGATYSATTEFQAVLGLCALEVDSRDGGTSRRDALRQGLIALDEADQFGGDQVDWHDSADVRRVAVGHTTPVLNQPGQPPVDSVQAVQAYYAYAEQRMYYACAGLPGASMAYYGMARTMTVPGSHVVRAAGKAALLYRVALEVSPQNVLAGNELGVLLAQHGQLDEAEQLFQYCVATKPTPEAYRNLAAVYGRKGDQRSSQAVMAAGEALAAHDRATARVVAPQVPLDQTVNHVNEPQQPAEKTGYLARFPGVPKFTGVFRR
jgi:tetratricopeptide (TPR) repeat protein